MADISDNARKLFNALPPEGKVGGMSIRDRAGLSAHDFRLAKLELRDAGLVELGRGRGGSLGRIDGAELPPEPKKPSVEERLADAREIKAERSKAQRERDALREHVIEVGRRHFPDAKEIIPGLYGNGWYIEVWDDNGAQVYAVPPAALL